MKLQITAILGIVVLYFKSAGCLYSGYVTPAQKELLTKFNDKDLFTSRQSHNVEPTDDVGAF